MKTIKLMSALMVLIGAQQVVVANEGSHAFTTWADGACSLKEEAFASENYIAQQCKSLPYTVQAMAELVTGEKYWCRHGIDGLVNAYGKINQQRIEELKKRALQMDKHLLNTPYCRNREKGIKKRGIHSQATFVELIFDGSPVYSRLYRSNFKDENAAKELVDLIKWSVD